MKVIIPNTINEQVNILEDLKNKRITQKEAVLRLHCTTRNTRKKLKKYILKGDKGLIHGNKGRASIRKVPCENEKLIIHFMLITAAFSALIQIIMTVRNILSLSAQ